MNSVIPMGYFSYYPKSHTFVTEASDIGGFYWINGFWMECSVTGSRVRFDCNRTLQEIEEFDGEVHGWEFISEPVKDQIFVCHILND